MDSSFNCNSTSNGISFSISSQDNICSESEFITCVLVLPISSLKQSSQGLPDWTCICVGLSSGTVKFFNQFGQMIFSQKIHSSSIEMICLRGSPRYNQPDIFREDLMIVCDNCCYEIDGVSLYESLNTFKKQLIRFQAGFIDDQWDSFELTFKKWLLDSHEVVSGMVFGYETNETIIDNIFNNVVNKGPFLGISEEASKYVNCVVVGKVPFVAFYKIPLESDSLDMGDLAHAVYSKVKGVLSTSLSSWMGSFTSSVAAPKQQSPKHISKKPDAPVSELPSRLQSRNVIDDQSRQGSTIIGCPHHNKQSRLAAMTDDFGRIFLLDIDDGMVLRMWKGYRDAQISISTTSDGSSTERSVNYLIIYAPRRSLIEVWTLPFGDKVASFDVRDRNGRLLHVPHTSLGFSNSHMSNQKGKNAHSTFFLDSSGKISVFDVPFHLSLSSSSNERSQDHLVLKHFKNVIRNESMKSNPSVIRTEFSSSIRLLKLPSSIEILMNNVLCLTNLPHEMILSVIDELLELLSSIRPGLSLSDTDTKRLTSAWTGTKSLIKGYLELTKVDTTMRSMALDTQDLGDLLNLEVEDCQRITNLLKYYSSFSQSTRTINRDSTYLLFVNNFTMLPNSSDRYCEGFQLSKNTPEKDILKIGTVLFSQSVTEEQPVEDIITLLMTEMKVDRSSCFRICLTYLINENPSVLMDKLSRVKNLLIGILSPGNNTDTDLVLHYRLIKGSLQIAYETIEKSSNLMTSLLIAMTIRVIILGFLQNGTLQKEEISLNLTEHLSSWNEICQRLEDLTIFDCFLKCRPLSDKSKKVNVSFDRELILFQVLEHGKGVFSERFAKWALKWNLKLSHIHELYKSLAGHSTASDWDAMLDDSSLSEEVKDIFSVLYKQLPHSLEYDSVLINVAWEYTRLWSKSIQRVEYLETACELLENIGPAGGLIIQGIGSMIWDMYLVVGLSALFPLDCTEDKKYSSHLSCDVTVNVIRFLYMLTKALENVDVIPTFSTEPVWCGDKSRSSLIDLAVNKDLIMSAPLDLHIQLLYSMQLVSMLNVRKFNCYNLFSKETRKYIFKSLTTGGNVGESLDNDSVECKTYRMRFLEKCIETCVKKFNESTDHSSLCQKTNVVVKLVADKWKIDLDDILQCWIGNYYRRGLDSQGAMYVDKVTNLGMLGGSLLKIVASRIKKEYLMPDTKYYRECCKYVTGPLKKWLQCIDDSIMGETVLTTLDRTDHLLNQILEWIPENCLDFEAATCLQSVMLNIQRTKKYIQ